MRILWIVLQIFVAQSTLSQMNLYRVDGLPTNEINDLHVDTKGYLWIAHGLGISRYDGLNFIHYSHPQQVNLRAIDIVEDRHGRIWYHNFSGQIFFIEKGKVHLLAAYDYKNENQNPKMALCGNDLLVTSYKGLFVCNTTHLKWQLLPFDRHMVTALVSLAVINNRAVVFNSQDWYIYDKSVLKKTSVFTPFQLPEENFIQLHSSTFNDTIFLMANPSGTLYKLRLEKNGVRFLKKEEHHDFINAVSLDEKPWIHTRNTSYNLLDTIKIQNYDLMDIVSDKEENTWYGSRREGLLASYRPTLWKKTFFPFDKNDYIRTLNANAGYFFSGTQKGNLYVFELNATAYKWKHVLFNGLGSIDFIRHIRNDHFIVGTSTNTYIVNAKEKKLVDSLPIKSILDVDFDSNSFYLATPGGAYVVPNLEHAFDKNKWLQTKQKQFPFFDWNDSSAQAYLLFPKRTRSIRFDSAQQKVYVSTKDGLYEINKSGIHPVFINQKEVFSTSLWYKDSRLYIATINDGLWVIDKNDIQHFTTANKLASNTIIRIKATEDHLWLFEKNGVQVLNLHTDQILQNLDLPRVQGGNVLDIAEKGDYAYLTTAEGVYNIPLNHTVIRRPPKGFLDYIIINGKDTVFNTDTTLPYHQNDVQFYISSPSFYNAENISFRYRLKGADDEWKITNPSERMIRYSTLVPGRYVFELFAVNSEGMQQEQVVRYQFYIAKPWWKTWWFFLLLNAVSFILIYFLIRNRINQKLKVELVRRNISSDLHDDIGATLSSINFHIDLAQEEENKSEYLDYIKESLNHAINNLDDLVWSINPKNDNTQQLINRMKKYADPLLRAARIKCHFDYAPEIFHLKLDLITKRHLYFLFKEMVNNVAKHAESDNCFINLEYHRPFLSLSVKDDGKGFDLMSDYKDRSGLQNMQERTQKLHGTMKITSIKKKGSVLTITFPVGHTPRF